MKKLASLIILVSITLTVFGQNGEVYPTFLKNSKFKIKSDNFGLENIPDNYQFEKNKTLSQLYLKEGKGLKQKLDSLVNEGRRKEEYTYDENGNLLSYIYSDWDINKWKGTDKYEFEYNASGNLIERVTYLGDNYRWKELIKYEYAYDADENIIQTISSTWKSGRWLNDSKTEYIHDNNEKRMQNISFSWEGNKWINKSKSEIALDSAGNNTHSNLFIWEGDQWINTTKYEYNYDTLGNRTLVLISSWLDDKFVNSWKDETEYDMEENTRILVSSEWQSEQWVKLWKREYADNANGVAINYTTYNWENDQWVESVRFYSEFDYQGNRIAEISMAWMENDWINNYKAEYSYDNEFSYEDLILPFSGENDPGLQLLFNHKLQEITYSNFNGTGWDVDIAYVLYYSEQNFTSLKDYHIQNQIKVYPNPATNQIVFNIDGAVGRLQLEILDSQGKLLEQQLINNNESVSIESLNSGLHFYRILTDGKSYNGKFIVK